MRCAAFQPRLTPVSSSPSWVPAVRVNLRDEHHWLPGSAHPRQLLCLDGTDVYRVGFAINCRYSQSQDGFIFQGFNLLSRTSALEECGAAMFVPCIGNLPDANNSIGHKRRWHSWGLADPRRSSSQPTCPADNSSACGHCSELWSINPRCCWPTSPPATSIAPNEHRNHGRLPEIERARDDRSIGDTNERICPATTKRNLNHARRQHRE